MIVANYARHFFVAVTTGCADVTCPWDPGIPIVDGEHILEVYIAEGLEFVRFVPAADGAIVERTYQNDEGLSTANFFHEVEKEIFLPLLHGVVHICRLTHRLTSPVIEIIQERKYSNRLESFDQVSVDSRLLDIASRP